MSRSASKYTGSHSSGGGTFGLKRRSFFQQEENGISVMIQVFKRSLFTANHLMIQSFQMHNFIFFLILILEYL